jgi:hypothetical protein
MANHRFNIGAIETPLRNQAKAQQSLCDSCKFQYDGDHWNTCDASIQEAGEVGLCYVVRSCSAYEDRRPVMALV